MVERIPQTFIDDLTDRSDITEIIGKRVEIKKAFLISTRFPMISVMSDRSVKSSMNVCGILSTIARK